MNLDLINFTKSFIFGLNRVWSSCRQPSSIEHLNLQKRGPTL